MSVRVGWADNGRMIVDCAIYRNGYRAGEPEDFSDAVDAVRAEGEGFVWVSLYEPTQEEFDLVTSEFALHPLAIEDAVKAHQRPKLERYEDSLFLVLKTLRYIDRTSDIETGEVMAFVGDGFVVTVRHAQASSLAPARRRLEADPDLVRWGPSAALYVICDAVVDAYLSIAGEVEYDLEQLENAVFSPRRGNETEQVYRLKREVLEFRRAALPLVAPVRQLAGGSMPFVPSHSQESFRDVSDHVIRVTEQVESFGELLDGIFSANLAQVSVQQNEDMRRLSAWVAIIAVPTLLAGIYGMNFQYLPGSGWRWASVVALAVMATACVTLYRTFRRTGWL